MEVDLIGVGTEVVKHVQKVLLVHLAAVEIAVDALGIDETRRPQLPPHVSGELTKQQRVQSLGTSVLAVEVDGQAVFFLWHPHAPYAVAGAKLDSSLEHDR